jgi:hypothetical protein
LINRPKQVCGVRDGSMETVVITVPMYHKV